MLTPVEIIALAVIAAIVSIETALLRVTVTETVRIKSLVQGALHSTSASVPSEGVGVPLCAHLPVGETIPAFQVQVIRGASSTLSSISLNGQSSSLVFCRLAEIALVERESLLSILKSVWHRVDGPIYIVMDVGAAQCHKLSQLYGISDYFDESIGIIPDANGYLKKLLQVYATPCAVILDEMTRVTSIGELSIDVSQTQTSLSSSIN